MTAAEYYNILGLLPGASVEEIKKAYRSKARLYHPDINPSPEAKDKFINLTEAYDFLITNHNKVKDDEQAYSDAMEDWRKYRQDISRRRANKYASASYSTFKKSKLYKTTKIFDSTAIVYSLVISVMVITYTIFGYSYRLKHPIPGVDKPSLLSFIMLLLLGALFLTISMIYLIAFRQLTRKNKKKN
jgi:hypothetical protein